MNNMKNNQLKNLVLSAMFLAIGMVLPFLTGQLQQLGNMLLPMHLPVFLCGLICSWKYGFAVGLIMPVMRSMLFHAPVMYPRAVAMAFELAVYGLVAGYLYGKSKYKCTKALYKSLIAAMLSGRAAWGIAQAVLLGISGKAFTLSAFIAGAFVNAWPGILLQLIIIPAIMVALGKAKFVPLIKKRKPNAETS